MGWAESRLLALGESSSSPSLYLQPPLRFLMDLADYHSGARINREGVRGRTSLSSAVQRASKWDS